MIESLIKYIQDKGYMVDVRPEMLIIRKYAKGDLVSKNWGITKEELNATPWSLLRFAADRELFLIEQAIENYQPI